MLNKQRLVDIGRKAAELGVERMLALGEKVEAVARQAAATYNELSEQAPIPLPKIPLHDVAAPGEASDSCDRSPAAAQEASAGTSLSSTAAAKSAPAEAPSSEPTSPAGEAARAEAPKAELAPKPKIAAAPEPDAPPAKRRGNEVRTAKPGRPSAGLRVPGRAQLRKWRRDEVLALCKDKGVQVDPNDSKARLIDKLHPTTAVVPVELSTPKAKLATRQTLMKRNREGLVELAVRYGLKVGDTETKRDIIDALYAITGTVEDSE